MEDNNIIVPMPPKEGKPETGPTLAETIAMNLVVTAAEGGAGGESGGAEAEVTVVRRKRGRPRKYPVEENTVLSLSPEFSATLGKLVQKRGRGRPPGTGKLQIPASLEALQFLLVVDSEIYWFSKKLSHGDNGDSGDLCLGDLGSSHGKGGMNLRSRDVWRCWFLGYGVWTEKLVCARIWFLGYFISSVRLNLTLQSGGPHPVRGGLAVDIAGGNITPHAITINIGEDIVEQLLSFAPRGPCSICVLSAIGPISIVDVCPVGYLGVGILGYEGRFELLTLSCSFAFTEMGGGLECKTGKLSASLANPDGSVFGGAIAGSLIVAGPIQLIIGSFKQSTKMQIPKSHSIESSTAIVPSGDSARLKVPTPIGKYKNVEDNRVVKVKPP
ncbi:hypothetical protein U1Q18_032887 [Sarracenia purpurea var. burkii]